MLHQIIIYPHQHPPPPFFEWLSHCYVVVVQYITYYLIKLTSLQVLFSFTAPHLTPLFNWNVKQLFLYLTAEYQTADHVSIALKKLFPVTWQNGLVTVFLIPLCSSVRVCVTVWCVFSCECKPAEIEHSVSLVNTKIPQTTEIITSQH